VLFLARLCVTMFFVMIITLGGVFYLMYEAQPIVKFSKKRETIGKKMEFSKIFQKFFVEKKEKITSIEFSKSTSIPPKVLGIFWAGKKSLALLKYGKVTKWCGVNESIGNWEVKKIKPEFVVLTQGKSEVILRVFKYKKGKNFERESKKIGKKNTKVFVVSKELMQRLTADMGTLFSQIGFRPYFLHGRIQGLQITYLNPKSILYKAGLRVGDVILTINDIPIRTTEDSYRIFETLKTASYIEVKVRRHGKIITLRAEVR